MTFTCEHCGGMFPETPSGDDGAHDEAVRLWGKRGDAGGMAQICDDCFHDFMWWLYARDVMRTWVRARRIRHCGLCGGAIAIGAAMVEYTLAIIDDVKVRCTACEGAPPEDLAPLPTKEIPTVAGPVRQLQGLPLDWAPASREPGEDG